MQYIRSDVSTICIGLAASMGSFLLMAGTKGKRFALPNSKRTGQPLEKIEKDVERDYYMSAEEAKAYGIIDDILQRH